MQIIKISVSILILLHGALVGMRPRISGPSGAVDVCVAAEYANEQDVVRCVSSVYSKVFPSEKNIFITGFAEGSVDALYKSLDKQQRYINKLLNQQRSIGQGISASNKELILRAIKDMSDINKEIINVVTTARATNYNFDKARYANVQLDAFVAQVKALMTRVDDLTKLLKKLEPGFLDITDVQTIKKILTAWALILKDILVKRIDADATDLRPGIRYAIDKQKQAR